MLLDFLGVGGWAMVLASPRRLKEILMTARLYGLWALSVILALIFEFLTPGMLTLIPVPW
jgi:hypothetical protein